MKIDRGEVERIAHNAKVATGGGMDMWLPPEVIAELCRTWLAVQDAPVGRVPRAKVGDLLLMSVSHDMAGQRVRLVRDGGE